MSTKYLLRSDGRKYMLGRGRIVVGRSRTADIKLTELQHSKIHAIMYVEEFGVTLLDQSRNGTFINGQRITTKQLSNGDQIKRFI